MTDMDDQVVADIDDNTNNEFIDVDVLSTNGINVSDVSKLKAIGIWSLRGLQMTTKKDLLNVKGFSEAKVDKIKGLCDKLIGSTAFDALLGGGVETQSITEFFGEFRTGKTQISHTLAVTTQLAADDGGAEGKVAFIDTEGTFRPDRIQQIAERFGVDARAVLDNIVYARAYHSEHQMDLIIKVAALLGESQGQYRLLIIDSIINNFRADYSGRGELADRQQKLNQMLHHLIKIAEEYNIAVLITNQMTADPGAMSFADPKKPVGGHILAHASTTRIYLRKGRGNVRIAKIYDSPNLPESEAEFEITQGGIAGGEST